MVLFVFNKYNGARASRRCSILGLVRSPSVSSLYSSSAPIRRITAKNETPCSEHQSTVQQQLTHSLRNLSHLLHHLTPQPQPLIVQIQEAISQLHHRHPLRISFYGSGRSRRSQVIDSLLLNTLEPSPSRSTQLLSHREDQLFQEGSLRIQFDQEPRLTPGCLKIPHPWLDAHKLEIEEIRTDWDHHNPLLSQPPSGDLVVVVLDALSEHHHLIGPRPFLPGSSVQQPLLVLLNSSHPQVYADLVPRLGHLDTLPLLHFDSSAALEGLRSMAMGDPDASALLRGSGLNPLRSQILSALRPDDPTPRLLKTLSTYQGTLSATTHLLLRLSEKCAAASTRLYEYQREFDQLAKHAHQILFPVNSQSLNHRLNLMDILRKEVPFHRLPFISDQVAYRVMRAVDEVELSQIEKNLLFQTGQMNMIKERSEELVKKIIQDPILKDYQSKVMINQILQEQGKLQRLERDEQGAMEQFPLIRLFNQRKKQLISLGGPVSIIQSKADHLAIKNLSASFGLSIITYFSYLGSSHLPVQLESFTFCFDNYKPISAFILVSLIWSSQSSWKKTTKKFVADFSRWRDSLNFDLSNQKQKMIDEMLLKQTNVGDKEEKRVKIIQEIQGKIHQSLQVNPSKLDNDKTLETKSRDESDDDGQAEKVKNSYLNILPYHHDVSSHDHVRNRNGAVTLVNLLNLFVKDSEKIRLQIKNPDTQK